MWKKDKYIHKLYCQIFTFHSNPWIQLFQSLPWSQMYKIHHQACRHFYRHLWKSGSLISSILRLPQLTVSGIITNWKWQQLRHKVPAHMKSQSGFSGRTDHQPPVALRFPREHWGTIPRLHSCIDASHPQKQSIRHAAVNHAGHESMVLPVAGFMYTVKHSQWKPELKLFLCSLVIMVERFDRPLPDGRSCYSSSLAWTHFCMTHFLSARPPSSCQ